MFQIQAAPPNCDAFTGSKRLCRAIAEKLRKARPRSGKCTKDPSAIMDQTSAQTTERRTTPETRLKFIAKRRAVSSSTISQNPRVQRNCESWAFVRPWLNQKNAPSPAVNMKTGAQICVTQRVKKRATVVRVRSSGWNDIAPQ